MTILPLNHIIEMNDIDIEAMSISILSCGGVANIPDFAEIASKSENTFLCSY
jgi:hypothetical protein